MINQNSSTIHIPSEKMLMELASMPKSIQFAALSYAQGVLAACKTSLINMENSQEVPNSMAG